MKGSEMNFGSCCNDLKDAMTEPPNSSFFVGENNVFYFSVGFVMTKDGPGWFDHAVFFCPFCGRKLQDREEIARMSKSIL